MIEITNAVMFDNKSKNIYMCCFKHTKNVHGNQLDPPLHKFAKIKPKAMSLRIVYRPVEKDEIVEMQIIAIGPRDRNEVYELAKKRMSEFFKEMK